MFTQEQLVSSLRATILLAPAIRAAVLVDIEQLHKDILTALPTDSVAQSHSSDTSNPRWSKDSAGLLRLDDRIYVPDTNDLHLRVLCYKHDHPLAGHFGQNCTLELVCREYTWPGVRTFVKDYVSSCTSCGRANLPLGTDPMVYSNNSRSPLAHGTLSPWTSSSNSPPPMDLPPSL